MSFSSLGCGLHRLLFIWSMAFRQCGLKAFLLETLCVGRDASVLFVAMSGLAQTIGFLGKFVKLNILDYHFVQNLLL
ncbi:hypothetical protein [Rhizobium leguminosarum]|uniref:hypothetical protein n=1 Tax=Rhizobium leguminosarum TaxID=384 RepID=UPI00144299FA|nr:hypothetical protein [Rhizobium leguminosarum]